MKTRKFYKAVVMLVITIFMVNVSMSQELTVPFCENVNVIGADLGSKISRFMVYKDFQQAILLKTDEGFFLSVTYKENGIFQVDKKAITEQEIALLCEEIISLNQKFESPDYDDVSQEARLRFITSTTSFSLGYYSLAIPTSLGAEDGKAYAASYLLIGGSGFFIPFVATRNKGITNGMARAYTVGATLGFGHGASFAMMMDDELGYKTFLGLTAVGSITESFVGLAAAKNKNYSWGRMSSVGSGGLWGYALGASMPYLLAESDNLRVYGLSTLAFSVGGMLAGNYLFEKQPITHGDATYINTVGVLGAAYPAAMINTFDSENGKAYILGAILGASTGIGYGIYRTKYYDYTRQQGNLISLGGSAGGLVGGGVAVIMEAGEKGTIWFTLLGATGGLFLTDMLVKDMGKGNSVSTSNLRIHFNPTGVLGLVGRDGSAYSPWDARYSNSLATLSLRF